MALNKKQRHQLKLSAKRRDRRPEQTIEMARPMTVKHAERERITRSNAGMLLRLETLLVEEAERDAKIDDGVLAAALRCVVQRKESPSEFASVVMDAIERWRFMEENDKQTEVAMRVIYNSIKTHSECGPGDYSYLIFASQFVKQTVSRASAS